MDDNILCSKHVPGCKCSVGFAPEEQCEDCKELIVRNSRCICSPKEIDLENKKYLLAQKVIEAMPKCTLCYKQIATRYEVFDEYDKFREFYYKEYVWRCDECGPRIDELDYAKELREYLKLMR